VASENPLLISAPAERSRESRTDAAPITVKLDPGNASNVAVMLGSDQ
jgi:hypothetical protein